jgi:hypothetical protein
MESTLLQLLGQGLQKLPWKLKTLYCAENDDGQRATWWRLVFAATSADESPLQGTL